MKFDAENQHAEAFKCRGFDGYMSANGDDGIVTGGNTTTKLGGLVTKGTDFAKSDKGQAAIAGAKTLFQVGKAIRNKRNPDEEVLAKCGKKPLLGKKKKNAWGKCREETIAARNAAPTVDNTSTPPDNSSTPPDNSVDNSIVTGGTPNQEKSQRPMDTAKTPFDWKKNWWVLPLGLGVLYLGYTKFIKKN
jgi:hypothetical protein